MNNDDFDNILQQLKSGQNPTSSCNSGITSGTQESNYGLRLVNEGTGDASNTSDK